MGSALKTYVTLRISAMAQIRKHTNKQTKRENIIFSQTVRNELKEFLDG